MLQNAKSKTYKCESLSMILNLKYKYVSNKNRTIVTCYKDVSIEEHSGSGSLINLTTQDV